MKQITAYVRAGMVNRLVDALETARSGDFTLMEARGIVGGLPGDAYRFSVDLGERFEPMVRLDLVCAAEDVDILVDAIRTAASTNHKGDGMIFVMSVDTAIRVSDGARGPDVLGQ
jgi:nitrogen regulatory protein P-II 1